MRLRYLPAFLPTRRTPAFSAADHRSRRDNSLYPQHFAALREADEPLVATVARPASVRLAGWLGMFFVPPAGEKFP